MNKKVRQLCKTISEEGYYRELLKKQKDREWKGRKVIKFFLWILHFNWVHFYEKEKEIKIDEKTYEVYKCKLCGAETIGDHFAWEATKWMLSLIGFILLLTIDALLFNQLINFPLGIGALVGIILQILRAWGSMIFD